MARIEGAGAANKAQVESNGALRVAVAPARGPMFAIGEQTGTLAAALAANACVFAMRLDPGAALNAYITRLRLSFTTIAAFTVPVTAGRRLQVIRGSGAAAASGTAVAVVIPHQTGVSSEFAAANGGDVRISALAALTVTGITFEANPLRTMTLAHVGAAGAFVEQLYELESEAPIVLQPGQLLAVRTPVAMDAGGTWQLGVNTSWYEAPAPTAL